MTTITTNPNVPVLKPAYPTFGKLLQAAGCECTRTYVTLWTCGIRYKPFAVAMVRVEGHEKTYIQSSRPWECGNPKGISKEGGKPASWLSMLSTLCHCVPCMFDS
jgi:hypothetical protein